MNGIISKLREKLGNDKFIHPGARIIVENENNEVLLIERQDTGQIGLPSGALEENESIEECIKREVIEETGIEILSLELIGISSRPENETVLYTNGDLIQYFGIEFYSNEFKGEIRIQDCKEVKSASFMDFRYLDQLPANKRSTIESLKYYKRTGKVRLN